MFSPKLKPILPKSQYLNCGILSIVLIKLIIFSALSFPLYCLGQTFEQKEKVDIYKDFDFEKLPIDLENDSFVQSKGIIPDLGWGKFKAWVKLEPEQLNGKKYLLIQNPTFDQLIIYSNTVKGKSISPGILLAEREVPNRYPVFNLSKINEQTVYVSGVSKLNPAKFPIRLINEAELNAFMENKALGNGLFLGITAVLVLLNLIIFLVFRLRAFGVFALSAALFATLYLFLEGYFYGRFYSKMLFENQYINFHYFIYFGFQLSNLWIFSSVFQLEMRNTNVLFNIFRILFLIGILEGIIMFFSPLWYESVSHSGVVGIGLTIRIGTAFLNVIMLLILLKIRNETPLALWFLVAMIPSWLSYLLPRFMPFMFHEYWFTMPQLYALSMVWYITLISLGLANMVYKNLKYEPVKKPKIENIEKTTSHLLSQREVDILMAFTNGFSYTEISDAMFISPHTVRTHLKNIYGKIGVNSKAEAVRWVLQKDYRT
jgi:DNA-binding CsgD family transcriptional regulator